MTQTAGPLFHSDIAPRVYEGCPALQAFYFYGVYCMCIAGTTYCNDVVCMAIIRTTVFFLRNYCSYRFVVRSHIPDFEFE